MPLVRKCTNNSHKSHWSNNLTAFAIITDNQTYANTKDAMHQYKTAVEDDGLATYLISGDWQNPDQVKQIIIKTYQECPSLEGLV